jgi:hypothetical protein
MEQSSMSQGYSEIPLKKPEESPDEDKKTKKTAKPRFGEYLLHDKKPTPPPNLESQWLPKKEADDKTEESHDKQAAKALPDGDTTWEDIQGHQRVEPETIDVADGVQVQLETVPPTVAETELPLDEGDVHDLPLDAVEASEIHRRVHFEVPEAPDADETLHHEQPPVPFSVAAAVEQSPPARGEGPALPEAVAAGGAGNGGGNFEPPQPPHTPEQPLGGPEPIRKEQRRSQKRQDTKIKTLQDQTSQNTARYEQRLRSQNMTNERVQRQFDTLRQQITHNEQHTRELHVEQIRQTHEATKRAAIAEKAIEQVVELPPEHHLEKSVWHNIEVDKTGRAVERPVLRYGQEFQREQHRETRPDDVRHAVAATGQFAVDRASHSATPQAPLQSQGMQIPKSMRESTKPKQPGPQLSQKLLRPWVLVVLIVAVFIVISLLIMH